MGTWGAGIFQSDKALDTLADLRGQLEAEIDRILSAEGAADADIKGEDRLMPTVAILRVLAEHLPGASTKPERIASWRDKYLEHYDRGMSKLADAEFISERRAVIEETFASLLTRSKEFHRRKR